MPRPILAVWLAALLCGLQSGPVPACPPVCSCWWKSGKEMVRCIGQGLTGIPEGVAGSTQVLDLSGNSLATLPAEMFLKANLLNLQRVYLIKCQLKAVHASAFARLANLVELDLSSNLLVQVPLDTFPEFPDLRRLSLSHNPIERVDRRTFVALGALTNLELSRCHIEFLSDGAFDGLPHLTQLKLDGNLLTTVGETVLNPLAVLHAIQLHDNPWRCDCHLRDLKSFLVQNKIHHSSPLVCNEPSRVHGRLLRDLDREHLACEPRQGGFVTRRIEAWEGDDAVLVCKVSANPEAKIHWLWQGRAIANRSLFAFPKAQLFLIRETGATNKTSHLTIAGTSLSNAGQYVCAAENEAGKFTTTVTLNILRQPVPTSEVQVGTVVGIFLGVMTFTMVFVILCILVIKRRHIRAKYLKHLSIRSLPVSFFNPFNRRRHLDRNSTAPELQALKTSNKCKRPPSPDAMTFLVSDFGVPRSPYLNRLQDNRPDVVHVNREDSAANHSSSGNEGNGEEEEEEDNNKDSSSCGASAGAAVNEVAIAGNIPSSVVVVNDDDDAAAADDHSRSSCHDDDDDGDDDGGKELASSCKTTMAALTSSLEGELDKLKWKEPLFSSSHHDLDEEIEMKVHLDHLSAESKWKCGQYDPADCSAMANEWPSVGGEWLVGDAETDFCKPYPDAGGWWAATNHELDADSNSNSYNICVYDKPSPTSMTMATAMATTNNPTTTTMNCVSSAANNNPGDEGEDNSPTKPHFSGQAVVSPNPSSFPPSFANFLYDTRETDL